MQPTPELSLVIPVYHEEAVLDALLGRATEALEGLKRTYELILVDDGSSDRTPELLREALTRYPRLRVVRLSRNFGLQHAVTAGLAHARGQIVGLMDGDLQDPPELLPQMLDQLESGHDVVYMLKRSRREPPCASSASVCSTGCSSASRAPRYRPPRASSA